MEYKMNTMNDLMRMVYELGPGDHRLQMTDGERALLVAFCKAYNERIKSEGKARYNVVSVVSDNINFGRKLLMVAEHEIQFYEDLSVAVNIDYVRARVRMMNDGDVESFQGNADFVAAVRVLCSNTDGKFVVQKTNGGCLIYKGVDRKSKKGDIAILLDNYTRPIKVSEFIEAKVEYIRTAVSSYNAARNTNFSVRVIDSEVFIMRKEQNTEIKAWKDYIPKALKDALVKLTYKGQLTDAEREQALDALDELKELF